MNDGWMELRLANTADREAVALALFRAGYAVKASCDITDNWDDAAILYKKGWEGRKRHAE